MSVCVLTIHTEILMHKIVSCLELASKIIQNRDFPSSPEVKTPTVNAGDMGSIPDRGNIPHGQFSSVQSLSHVGLFVTPWTVVHQVSLYITKSWSLLKLMSIELVMPFNHRILCHPLLLLSLIFPTIKKKRKKVKSLSRV